MGAFWTGAGWALRRGFPPGPGRGSRLSLEKARTQRVAGEGPRPPFFMARLLSLARFGGCAALFRSMGYYGAHVRALIWGAFSGRAAQPRGFPLGGRWAGEAGSDEGAICYPTFPCRKGTLSRLSPQRGFSIAPLGNPVAPSSVTFGDSFPPRGSLWVVQPYTKKRPKSGYVHGPRNSPTTGTMWHPTPKRASGNERALKMGGRGASPRDSLRPGFL